MGPRTLCHPRRPGDGGSALTPRILIAALLALLPLAAAGCDRKSVAAGPEAPPRPHVIFISIDTLRADHLGCYGYRRGTSPRIDDLARHAVRFENAYAHCSWTLPSHLSMMTSQYPHVHGVENDRSMLPASANTLAESMSAAGYQAAAFVSWTYVGKRFGFAQGFSQFTELLPPAEQIDDSTKASFKAEEVTDRAIRWLEGRQAAASPDAAPAPLFLFLHYFDPHIDYDPPPPFDRMFDPDYRGPATGGYRSLARYIKGLHEKPERIAQRDLQHVTALYDGEIRYTDAHVGRLLDALDRLVGLDNCLIVLTSDHGEELDDHGSMEGHQWTLYEEVVRIPLIIKPPGASAPRVVQQPAQHIDIAPTILGSLRTAAPPSFQGRNLANVLDGGAPPGDLWLFGKHARHNQMQYVRCGDLKLIHTVDTGVNSRGIPVAAGFELYDLKSDPGETTNLYSAGSPVAAAMAERLAVWAASGVKRTGPLAAPRPSADESRRLQSVGYVGSDAGDGE